MSRLLYLKIRRLPKITLINMFLFVLVIIMSLVLILIPRLASGKTDGDWEVWTGNTQTNLANRGLVIETAEWIYYADSAARFQIKRVARDDGHMEFVSGVHGMYLNTDEEHLYYVDAVTKCLTRVRLDGSEIERLTDCPVGFAVLNEDGIIYTDLDSDGIVRCNKDGTVKKVLSTVRTEQIIMLNGRMYFSDLDKSNTAVSVNRRDGAQPVNYNFKLGQSAVFCGDALYFIDTQGDYRLYRVAFGEMGPESASDAGVGIVTSLTASGEDIYYTRPDQGGCLFKRTRNGDEQKITDFPIFSPQVAQDTMYFYRADDEGAMYKMNMKTNSAEKLP